MKNTVWFFIAVFSASTVAFDGQPLYYEIDWGPVTLADARVELLDSAGVRSVTADIKSRGASAWFSDFRSTLEILYTRDGTKLLNGESTWGDIFSNITVIWPASGLGPTVDLYRSEPRDNELTPVSEESIVDTVDPFTPVFEMVRILENGKKCVGSYRIFDGIRRYDLQIQDGGLQTLETDVPSNFSGSMRRCDITVNRIGGFSTKKGWFRIREPEISRTLYLGKIRGYWLPIQFEISAPLGKVVARLMDINYERKVQ
tara:strand:+ start:4824 stop:5597 length:774 start_codon:yes stop_codon:yes gene_type:complete